MTPERIASEVAEAFGLTPAVLKQGRRFRRHGQARGVAMMLMRDLLGLSYPECAREFRLRNHTSAMHSIANARAATATPGLARDALFTVLNVFLPSQGEEDTHVGGMD